MLNKYIKGRLGNQMFQYAAMRGFQQKYFPDQKINLSFQKVEKKYKNKNVDYLKNFNTEYTNKKIKINVKQRILIVNISFILFIYKYIIRKNYSINRDKIEEKYKKILLKNNIIWKTNGYTDFDINLIDKNKDIIFYGYFESPKYFNNSKNIIKNDFTFKKDVSDKKLLNEINNSNSVCISIRRGDFVKSKAHFVCNNDYFYEAINIMNKKVRNPKYIIFSDDINWVKENFKIKDALYESGNDSLSDKLTLMSSCKHFIISNSSFSWWSQYLSNNEDKIVVAPAIWNNLENNTSIYEDNWILINRGEVSEKN